MTLCVWTARMGYRGEDALNVTRKSATTGIVFAPSWGILRPFLDRSVSLAERDRVRDALALNPIPHHVVTVGEDDSAEDGDEGADEARALWAWYRGAFWLEMRTSYAEHRADWDALLSREAVTLLCYCTDPRRCHRTLLSAEILPRLGTTCKGERP